MVTTFSKRGLSVRQFRRNIAQLWQPTIAKRFTSVRPFSGALPFGFNMPLVP
jgi:hypothetical protein